MTRQLETSAVGKVSAPAYYAWLKDFMEAGKERLTRDMTRDATKGEVQGLKRGNARLKQLVAELSLHVHVLKKNGSACSGIKGRYAQVSAIEKSEILSMVAGTGLPRRRALTQLGLAKSTYYRWLKRQVGGKLQDSKGGSPVPWNKLSPEEEEMILVLAKAFPEAGLVFDHFHVIAESSSKMDEAREIEQDVGRRGNVQISKKIFLVGGEKLGV